MRATTIKFVSVKTVPWIIQCVIFLHVCYMYIARMLLYVWVKILETNTIHEMRRCAAERSIE